MVTPRPMTSGAVQVMDADPEWPLTGRAKGRCVMSRLTGKGVSLSFANEHPAPVSVRPTRRVVVTAFGSLGDLYPYLAIALGLKSRGHEAVVATSACYRRKVEARGLGFRAMRPDSTSVDDPEVMRRVMELRTGTERRPAGVILPACENPTRTPWRRPRGPTCWSPTRSCFAARLVAEADGHPLGVDDGQPGRLLLGL